MCATSSANPLPKIHCRISLIAGSPIIEGTERSGWQLDLTTAFEDFQITNVHPTDGYGVRGFDRRRFSTVANGRPPVTNQFAQPRGYAMFECQRVATEHWFLIERGHKNEHIDNCSRQAGRVRPAIYKNLHSGLCSRSRNLYPKCPVTTGRTCRKLPTRRQFGRCGVGLIGKEAVCTPIARGLGNRICDVRAKRFRVVLGKNFLQGQSGA